MTDKAKSLALSTLEKYPISQRSKIVEQSIMNSWKGLFPIKGEDGKAEKEMDKE